jgi:hypothetical protein
MPPRRTRALTQPAHADAAPEGPHAIPQPQRQSAPPRLPADPPTLRSAVPDWHAGNTIPLGRDRALALSKFDPRAIPTKTRCKWSNPRRSAIVAFELSLGTRGAEDGHFFGFILFDDGQVCRQRSASPPSSPASRWAPEADRPSRQSRQTVKRSRARCKNSRLAGVFHYFWA